jgi:NAD dependent epimerase/dehydratase family enzyme
MAQDTLLASTQAVPARLEGEGFTFRDPLIDPALTSIVR